MLNRIMVPSAYGVQIRKITDGTVEREILKKYRVRSVSFAPTGTLLLAVTVSGEAVLHDINNEVESEVLQDLGGDVVAGVFGATADIVAFSLSSGKVVIRLRGRESGTLRFIHQGAACVVHAKPAHDVGP